jgi:hypothetical protein
LAIASLGVAFCFGRHRSHHSARGLASADGTLRRDVFRDVPALRKGEYLCWFFTPAKNAGELLKAMMNS